MKKENNAFSVALESSKKELEVNLKKSGKEVNTLIEELETDREYNIQQKLEKKLRQKRKKGTIQIQGGY